MKSLKVNDTVLVISGDHKGEKAKIVKIDGRKACLEGIGEVERHLRKSYLNPTGGKKTVYLGIDLSNLKLVEAYEYKKGVKPAVKKVDNSRNRAGKKTSFLSRGDDELSARSADKKDDKKKAKKGAK